MEQKADAGKWAGHHLVTNYNPYVDNQNSSPKKGVELGIILSTN